MTTEQGALAQKKNSGIREYQRGIRGKGRHEGKNKKVPSHDRIRQKDINGDEYASGPRVEGGASLATRVGARRKEKKDDTNNNL